MFTQTVAGIELTLDSAPTLFSPDRVDAGTLAMLSRVTLTPGDKVLDLGCGYGAVGIWAARQIGEGRVLLSDSDPVAVACARENALHNGLPGLPCILSDGFSAIDDTGFTLILSNPPYHTDFAVAKHFIEKGFNRLATGGVLMMVTKRRSWYEQKITAVFGGVRVSEIGGYFVFFAQKRNSRYASSVKAKKGPTPPGKKTARRQTKNSGAPK